MGGDYQAFLLRLQRGQGQAQWRATLQNAQTGEILRFATERELLRYLMEILTAARPEMNNREADNINLE